MKKNAIITLLVLAVSIEAIALSCQRFILSKKSNNEKSTQYSTETQQKSTFTLLMNENTKCHCLFNINFNGELMLYYNLGENRITQIGSVSDKSIILGVLEDKGHPKEDEAFHLALDVRTPKDSIEMFKATLTSAGIYECELVKLDNHSGPIYLFDDREVIRLTPPVLE